MPRKFLLVILVAVFSAAACAESRHTESTLIVDLDAVVESGNVQPVDGITSAGQPDAVALKIFAEQGYTTVIDMRAADEERGMDETAVINDLGMNYVVFPIAKPAGISFENAAKLDQLIQAADGPVLVHCASGNRVGALLALRASLGGADDATALRYGKEGGMTRLEGRVKEVLAKK
jgi:uncharacterized protein (TIGR01244 family)